MPETPLSALRGLTKAWLRKDPVGMARWLTEDVIEIGPTFVSVLAGRKELLRKYQQYFDGHTLVADYRIVRPRTVPLSPKLVLVYFRYTLRTTTGEIARDSHGKESILIEKHRNGWKIKFIHWHEDPQM